MRKKRKTFGNNAVSHAKDGKEWKGGDPFLYSEFSSVLQENFCFVFLILSLLCVRPCSIFLGLVGFSTLMAPSLCPLILRSKIF